MGLLCYLSLFKPSAAVGALLFPHSDKLGHFVFYAILYALLYPAIFKELQWKFYQPIAIGIAFGLGVVLECVQELYTLHRTGSLLDVLSNGLGILVSYLIFKTKKVSFY
jgi:glycopeptide antibiotics resistance protein